jgi:putative DNA primase/helicase
MTNVIGQIRGLQVIRARDVAKRERALEKEYWPKDVGKKGTFHLIGTPQHLLLVAEGYATGASAHEATGFPVAIVWDAGNIAQVVKELHVRYPRAKMLILADDDALQKCRERECRGRLVLTEHPVDCPHCGKPHQAENTGVSLASTAAVTVRGAFAKPIFANEQQRRADFLERGIKATDYNDLHKAEGLHVVRAQIEARLLELGWSLTGASTRASSSSGAGGAALRPIDSEIELLERFALIYGGGGAVYDAQEHVVIALSDMRDACRHRELHKAWMQSPERRIVRPVEVDFDPACSDPNVTCNLWSGWPTQPKAGRCDKLLELLRHMCSHETKHADALHQWVLRWLAYPIQHPGAKMRTTIVLHGPQGTGKNLFFEAVMRIYGPYGRIIDQASIEDKFNDWASKRLFLIADEVVARSDLFHVKNKLKAFITGTSIRINAKNVAARDERNNVNMVFLSNESMPVALEEDDRRHAVVWTPGGLPADFYKAVAAELEDGGVAALHDYLLGIDLGDFHENTKPPYTEAKEDLIDLGRESPTRFHNELLLGNIGKLPFAPCLVQDCYVAYKGFCHDIGVKPAPQPKFTNAIKRKHDVANTRERYVIGQSTLGPHGFLLFGQAEPPPGKQRTTWLGECVEAFRNAIDDSRHERGP